MNSSREKRQITEEEVENEEEEYMDEFTQARQEALREIDPELYDPHPDEGERLKCQHAYLSLLTTLKTDRKRIISDPKNTRLNEILKESDELYKNVKRPVDSVLDSKLLVASADLGHLRLKNIPSLVESSFTADDLCEGLKAKFPTGNDEFGELLDFVLLGDFLIQTHSWNGTHVLKRQLQSLQVPRHKQQQSQTDESQTTKQRRRRTNNEPEAELEIAQEMKEPMGEKETFDFVRDVFLILEEMGGRCPYYQFILNPSSFARSVENMFYVAFLVKDDRVKITGSSEEDLEVQILNEEEADLPEDKRQIIMDLTMDRWTQLCQKFAITKALINT